MVVEVSSEVVASSTTAVGVWLKNVRWISRRTQLSTAHNNGGWAGVVGPGAMNGERKRATRLDAKSTIVPVGARGAAGVSAKEVAVSCSVSDAAISGTATSSGAAV